MFFGTPGGVVGDGVGVGQSSSSPPPPGSMAIKQDDSNRFSSFFEQTFGQPSTFSQQIFGSGDNTAVYDDKYVMGTEDKGSSQLEEDNKEAFSWVDQRKPVVYSPDSVAEWMAGRVQRPALGMSAGTLNYDHRVITYRGAKPWSSSLKLELFCLYFLALVLALHMSIYCTQCTVSDFCLFYIKMQTISVCFTVKCKLFLFVLQ